MYWLDWLDWSDWIGLDNNGWMRRNIFCKDGTYGTDGMDGLDRALVGLGWDRRLLKPSRMGATEQEHHHWLDKKGRMVRMDLIGRWWDRGGTDKR